MYHTEASILIERPLPAVFAVVSDLRRHKDWQDGLIEASWSTAATGALGARFNYVSQFAGTRWDLPGHVTGWKPPNGWQWQARSGPFPVQGGFRLEAVGASTHLTMFSDSEPKGWMNALRPILKWMGERTYLRGLSHLKTILETH